MDPKDAALFKALAKAQALAKGVEKDARNKHHGYDYTSAEGMITEAKIALAQCGLALVPTSARLREPTADERPLSQDKGDVNKGARCVLVASWAIVHEEGGLMSTTCEWPVIPEAGRPLDKALAAARTASLNYLLRDVLQLPRVEEGTDLDHDSRDRAPPPPPDDGSKDAKAQVVLVADDIINHYDDGELVTTAPRAIAKVCGHPATKAAESVLLALIAQRQLGAEWNPSPEVAEAVRKMHAAVAKRVAQ